MSITDALHLFPADEIVISAGSERDSNWLAKNTVDRARRLFPHPIHHLVVERARTRDLAAA